VMLSVAESSEVTELSFTGLLVAEGSLEVVVVTGLLDIIGSLDTVVEL